MIISVKVKILVFYGIKTCYVPSLKYFNKHSRFVSVRRNILRNFFGFNGIKMSVITAFFGPD